MLNKNISQIETAVLVSRLYYIDKLNQTKIAQKLDMSRPTVSRLLQLAHDKGIVEIKIHDPFDNISSLDKALEKKYRLKKVILVDQIANSYNKILDQLGIATAKYLQQIIKDNDIIGLSWGHTISAVAKHLKPSIHRNIRVVFLKGSVSNSARNNYSQSIAKRFNEAFHTQTSIIPVPVIFESQATHDAVLNDTFIDKIIQEGKKANIAIFTAGTTKPNAPLFQLGYLDKKTIKFLMQNAAGDIISQFIDKKGQIVSPKLTKRTVSLSLDQLKEKETSILVAGGAEKFAAIHAALMGNYANVLITDIDNGKKLFFYNRN